MLCRLNLDYSVDKVQKTIQSLYCPAYFQMCVMTTIIISTLSRHFIRNTLSTNQYFGSLIALTNEKMACHG